MPPQFVSVLGAATQGIGSALRRTVSDGAVQSANPFVARTGYHQLLQSFYDNALYEDAKVWQSYKARFRLPRSIRSVYNPTRRAVDWYSGHVYPGAWTRDGRATPDGALSALPFTQDTLDQRPELVLAGLQGLMWGNWPSERHVYVRDGAKLGSVFVVIVDDLERGKVYPDIVPLSQLTDLTLDATGNVKGYAIEYAILSPRNGRPVTFRREVTPDRITEQEDRDVTLDEANPYGFVPAIWVRHRHVGGLFGAPAIDGVIAKIDELNALVSAVHNYIHRWHNQPMVFYGGSPPTAITTKGGVTEDDGASAEIERVRWMHSNDAAGHVDPLMQAMAIGEAGTFLTNVLEEIESDLPEITMDEQLRSITGGLTGPGADRMMSDVRSKLAEAESNYDAGTIKLLQMLVAIGGWRLSTGAWGPRSQVSAQQALFNGFDLTSYAKQELDVELLARPLVTPTPMERLLQWQTEKAVLGLSDAEMRRRAGIDQVTAQRIDSELAAEGSRDIGRGLALA